MEIPLRICRADDASAPPEKGYARAPKWITALPESELSAKAKTVLDAVVGLCFKERHCHASVVEIAKASGTASWAVERAIVELRGQAPPTRPRRRSKRDVAEATVTEVRRWRLIERFRDTEKAGMPWRTNLLFDPSGLDPETALLAVRVEATTQRRCRVDPAPVQGRPSAGAGSPAYSEFEKKSSRRRQERLPFDGSPPGSSSSSISISDQINPLIARALDLLPQLSESSHPARTLISIHGEELFGLALNRIEILRKKGGPKTANTIRFLDVVLENWQGDLRNGKATMASLRAENALAKPVVVQRAVAPVEPTGPLDDEELAGLLEVATGGEVFARLAAKQLRDAVEQGRVAAEKVPENILLVGLVPVRYTGCGSSAKTAPQPAGDPSLVPANFTTGENPQENQLCESSDQRARKDSNLQPSDSKAATLSVEQRTYAHFPAVYDHVADLQQLKPLTFRPADTPEADDTSKPHGSPATSSFLAEKPANTQSEGFSPIRSDVGDVRPEPQRLEEHHDAQMQLRDIRGGGSFHE